MSLSIVFGCSLDSNLHAIHKSTNNEKELAEFRGSKYVQSNLRNTFSEIKTLLELGRQVMFVGTPCQTAGLKSFIKKKDSNLLLVDFICHGVPSQKVFDAFVKNEELKYNSKMLIHRFRNKDHGWQQTGLQLGSCSGFANGMYIRRYPAFKDSYMNGFLSDLYLRPSCYYCKFKSLTQDYADITVADFWGVKNVAPNLNDGKGTSLVLLHSQLAEKVWDHVIDRGLFKEVSTEKAITKNLSIMHSPKIPNDRDKFFHDFDK